MITDAKCIKNSIFPLNFANFVDKHSPRCRTCSEFKKCLIKASLKNKEWK